MWGGEGRGTEGRCADVLVSRPEKFIVTTRSKYLLTLMKRFVKLILFLQVVKGETDEMETEEPEDETERKLGGPSEMELKVLYTYLTYRNVFGYRLLAWVSRKSAGPDAPASRSVKQLQWVFVSCTLYTACFQVRIALNLYCAY